MTVSDILSLAARETAPSLRIADDQQMDTKKVEYLGSVESTV
jgi:hypothetical protein